MENTVTMYESRISDMEKRHESETSSLKNDNRRLISVLKSRHKNELESMFNKYNPVFEEEKYLKILDDKKNPSVPVFAGDESVEILEKNQILTADEIRGVRNDASDFDSMLTRLKKIEYENSVPEAFNRLYEKGSSIISKYEKGWERSAVSLAIRNEVISSFSSAFDYYISETGVSGYILFVEDNDRISVYMNRILELSDGDRGYVFRTDSELIGEIEFYTEENTVFAKLVPPAADGEEAAAVEIKPFDRILVQVE